MSNKTEEVRQYIREQLDAAKIEGLSTKDIRAGDIQKSMDLKNVPKMVCDAMRSVPFYTQYDVLHTPPRGNSTTLEFRYYLSDVQITSDNSKRASQTSHDHNVSINSNMTPLEIPELDIRDLLKNVLTYYEKLNRIENHRYRSWEHCHSFFMKNRNVKDDETIDLMCLHLSNYLASWGMFRGKSFLLQKDYKVHNEVVHLLLEPRFNALWDLNVKAALSDPLIIKCIFELSQGIADVYHMKTKDFENKSGRNTTDILITKILLGVFGCVPAYDRYFQNGLRITKIAPLKYTEKSIIKLMKFYNIYYDELETIRMKISEEGIPYPQMKIIDMCFWQLGINATHL